MRTDRVYHERQLSGTQWFWFLAVVGLVTRAALLRFATAETTDGILCLTQFTPDFVDTPRFVILPGYPFLLHLLQLVGMPGWIAGRGLAALAGLLFLFPLWNFSRRWMSVEMSGMVCLMALFSPLLWQWSLKVMPDTLFLFLFWWSLERLTTVHIERKPSAWLTACAIGALAACVRPEGFLLLPWVAFLGAEAAVQKGKSREGLGLPFSLGAVLVCWFLPALFMKDKFLKLLEAYREGAGLIGGTETARFPFLNIIDHFYAYLAQPLYIFTPLVFWFAVLGLAKMTRRKDVIGEAFRRIPLQVLLLLFLSRLVPATYQDRHLLPFLPLLLVAAGYQLETFLVSLGHQKGSLQALVWKNGILFFGMLYLVLFSSAVLLCQRDSFGDIKRSSTFLKSLPEGAVLYSDEVPKTQYWSGRKISPIDYSQKPFMPKVGDYVTLHSFYSPRISVLDTNLKERFGAVAIHSESSMVVPLLTDLMEDPSLQNRTGATGSRFRPQFFISVVYEIKGLKPKAVEKKGGSL